jgi:uncharacterized SAM-binding protein YcdF (DUF218 family)
VVVLAAILVGGLVAVWPRDDEPADPDAVVVLGGAGRERMELGRALAERHDATLVLSSTAAFFGERAGLSCGVDALCLEPDPGTTIGEARMTADLAAHRGWTHVTIATSRFHTTRSRVLFRQCLDEVSVVGTTRPDGTWFPGIDQMVREIAGTLAALSIEPAC